jgi:N-acetylglutamate synthase
MLLVEELAARGWPAAETLRADGWLLRHTPALARRRSNSALPVGDRHGDLALVEDFYARHGGRALVQVSPAEAWTSLDSELARRGWSSEGRTDVLVAGTGAVLACTQAGEVALAARPDASWVAAWAACEERPDADAHAREVLERIEPATAYALAGGDLGVGLAVCERGWAGLFCVATAASRAPARHRAQRGPRAHMLGRRAWGAADLPTGRGRQRARARALRERGLPALARLSLPGGPGLGPALRLAQLAQRLVDLGPHVGARHLLGALLLDLEVDLLAEDGDFPRGLDPDAHLLAHDRKHGHLDVVSDHDALIRLPGQDQHVGTSLPRWGSGHLNNASGSRASDRRIASTFA